MKSLIVALFIFLGISPLARAEWGIVFGVERTLASAQYEIYRADNINLPNNARTGVYFRRNRYNSVLIFESQQDAQNSLRTVNRNLGRGSYVVNLQSWCAGSQPRIQYTECY